MSQDISASRKIALIPCNGLSARGQLTRMSTQLIHEQMDDVQVVDLAPLMAGVPGTLQAVQEARTVIGVAGCSSRCENVGCQKVFGQQLKHAIVFEELVPPHIRDTKEIKESDLQQLLPQAVSQLIGKIISLS